LRTNYEHFCNFVKRKVHEKIELLQQQYKEVTATTNERSNCSVQQTLQTIKDITDHEL